MNRRYSALSPGMLIAGLALSALASAGSAVRRAPEATPQSPANAEARRAAAVEKRRRKNAKRAQQGSRA